MFALRQEGYHEFTLEEKEGVTEFVQKENFSGVLIPFIDLSSTEEGFKLTVSLGTQEKVFIFPIFPKQV